MAKDEFVIWASESDYDTLEPFLVEAGIQYQRSKLQRFSIDPVAATILTIAAAKVLKSLAALLAAYLKQRKRRIAITKSDGTTLVGENYNVEEIERLLRSSLNESNGHIHIESSAGTEGTFTEKDQQG